MIDTNPDFGVLIVRVSALVVVLPNGMIVGQPPLDEQQVGMVAAAWSAGRLVLDEQRRLVLAPR